MKVARLLLENFRGIRTAELYFGGHTLLVGGNNVGKSTICEALDLVLGPDRLNRFPVAQEYDFYNGEYLSPDGVPIPIRIEVVLTELTPEILRRCANNLEHWNTEERRLLETGEIESVDSKPVEQCLRIITIAQYNADEDEFEAKTYYAHSPDALEGQLTRFPKELRRSIGFLYLRALRTGSRALSLERGSLLDIILRMKDVRTGLWERTRSRLRNLEPPIREAAEELGPILDEIEERLGEFIPINQDERATHLFVSQLTREHLRKTITFFLSMANDQEPIPFQAVGTGTLNTLVLALLSFIAEIKKENVIFAMEEPEIALPPHAQRRIANYLLGRTTQCFVTSHSPYVIERFQPDQIMILKRDTDARLSGTSAKLPSGIKATTYRSQLRRAIAEAMLGQAVIVGEGLTEQLALGMAAQKLEEADPDLFPLDLAGVSIVNNGGDGNLSEIGTFFKELGLRCYAFYDQRKRKPEEDERIEQSFDVACRIPHKGMEALLAIETPLDVQWQYLQEVRETDPEGRFGIPKARPDDDVLRNLSESTLKGTKGEGGAAALIARCAVDDIPTTISGFLRSLYDDFPRPKSAEAPPNDSTQAAQKTTFAANGVVSESETQEK